jgi:hypothetical protein
LNPDKVCLIIVKYYKTDSYFNGRNLCSALEYVATLDIDYANLSVSGEGPLLREKAALEKMLKKGVKIAVAAGNGEMKPIQDFDGKYIRIIKNGVAHDPIVLKNKDYIKDDLGIDLDKKCDIYPGCYNFPNPNFRVVGSTTGYENQYGGYNSYSNFGAVVKYWEDGTNQGLGKLRGTSQATAIYLGKWIAEEVP